jgi:type II secretory pathway pseudopilin PulG
VSVARLLVLLFVILALGIVPVVTWWIDRRRMRREAAELREIRIFVTGLFKRDVQ